MKNRSLTQPLNRLLAFLIVLAPAAVIASEGRESCERLAIAEGIRRAGGELSPAELYAADVKVESIEPAGMEVYDDHSIIQYLVTMRLNEESRVVYAVKTRLSGATGRCQVQRTITYRKRAEL